MWFELIGLKIADEILKGLRYKLHMMGIPNEGVTNVCFCDNEVITRNKMLEGPDNFILFREINMLKYFGVCFNVCLFLDFD